MEKLEENNSRVSITFEMIRYITLYYLTVAVFLTFIQVFFEYKDIRSTIEESVSNIFSSFNDSLTNSIWEFNDNQTETILKGINQSPVVLGVKLIQPDNKVIYELNNKDKNQLKNVNQDKLGFFNPHRKFQFEHTLVKKLESGKSEVVGKLIVFSGNKVILDNLSSTIFYILVNSIIKTISLWTILIIFLRKKVKDPLGALIKQINDVDPQKPKVIEFNETEIDTIEVHKILVTFNSLIKELSKFKDVLEAIVENKSELLKEKSNEVQSLVAKLKNAQDQIINQEKMHSHSLVAAGIAHELKNPLNVTKNSIIILKNFIEEFRENQNHEDYLEDIEPILDMLINSSDRMEAIIRNMLLQAKPEYIEPTKIKLSEFVDVNLKLVQKSLKTKVSQSTKIEVDINEDIIIDVYPNEFGRLIVNLFENSFYALGEKLTKYKLKDKDFKPELKVSAKFYGTDKVLLTFHDNGVGIPKDIREQIFKPFFTTKPTGLGTGLGLYLVSDIVHKHNGELIIHSEEEVYTEFQIILPLKNF